VDYAKQLEAQNESLLERCKLLETQVEFYKWNVPRFYTISVNTSAMNLYSDRYMENGALETHSRISTALSSNSERIRVVRTWGRRYPWALMIDRQPSADPNIDTTKWTLRFYIAKNPRLMMIFHQMNFVKEFEYETADVLLDSLSKYIEDRNLM
jgi:hypothetical protein